MSKHESQESKSEDKPKSHPNLPIVEEKKVVDIREAHNPPPDADFNKGTFVMTDGFHVGEKFALAIHEPDCYGKTHSMKNTLHFWQGNAADVKLQFEKA